MKFNLQCNSSSNETSLVELQSIVLVRGVFIFSILEEEISLCVCIDFKLNHSREQNKVAYVMRKDIF